MFYDKHNEVLGTRPATTPVKIIDPSLALIGCFFKVPITKLLRNFPVDGGAVRF
jgi:hypothetical protein